MTNFDFLLAYPQFEPFASTAVATERVLHIDIATCAVNCRRAMEAAVKWIYSVDGSLAMPYDTRLVALMGSEELPERPRSSPPPGETWARPSLSPFPPRPRRRSRLPRPLPFLRRTSPPRLPHPLSLLRRWSWNSLWPRTPHCGRS